MGRIQGPQRQDDGTQDGFGSGGLSELIDVTRLKVLGVYGNIEDHKMNLKVPPEKQTEAIRKKIWPRLLGDSCVVIN